MLLAPRGGASSQQGLLCISRANRHPGLSKEELYWRLDFLAGALTYAMADFGLIKRPASVSEAAHRSRAARELIQFAEAGFRAASVS